MKVKSCGLNIDPKTMEINEKGELAVKAQADVQGEAVDDATDATDVITQFNALLTSLRTAKIIKNS